MQSSFLAAGLLAIAPAVLCQEPDASTPTPAPDPSVLARTVATAFSNAPPAAFDANIQFSRKNGDAPWEPLFTLQVKLAFAPGGKLLFWAGGASHLQYILVSDGKTTWAYSPAEKHFVRIPAAAAEFAPDSDAVFPSGVNSSDRDLLMPARLIVPALSQLTRNLMYSEMHRPSDIPDPASPDRTLPTLSLLAQKGPDENQRLIELVLDPADHRVLRMEWKKSRLADGEQRFVAIRADFERIQLGGSLPPSFFSFTPPDDARPVDRLPVPGLDLSFLISQNAPDFSFSAGPSPPSKLSAFQGRPVLIAFWDPRCDPCREQMHLLARAEQESPNQKLVVLGVHPQNRPIPDTERAKLPRLLTEDPGGLIQSLYHIHFVPTLIAIDSKGVVRGATVGFRTADELKALLSSIGL